jgi:putative aldouronate transport system substrate-binding protein
MSMVLTPVVDRLEIALHEREQEENGMKRGRMALSVVLVALFALVLGLTQAVASGGSGETATGGGAAVTPAGTLPIVKTPITISAYAILAPWIQDLKTNDATIELEKRTGIHLDLIVVPGEGSNVNEKRNLMLASGDYPEIFMSGGFNNADILQYGMEQKIFQPINDLIEKYGLNVKKTMAYYPDLKANLTAPDGNIYGLPGINEFYHCTYSQKAWINDEWLKKLNLKMPTTTDEFAAVLKAFKEKDPNGNGKADEIPLMGSINSWQNPVHNFLLSAFVYANGSDNIAVKNGILSFSPAQPEWREGLRYIRQLYKDGLIYPASWTQSREQAQQIGDNPDIEILGAGTCGHLGMYMRIEDNYDRPKHWEALAPLKGPKGVQFAAIYRGISGAGFVITKKCKNPEAAFRMADYIYSEEGTILMEMGLEGINWKKAGPNDKGLEGEPARFTDTRSSAGHGNVYNTDWGQAAATVRTATWRAAWSADQNLFTVGGYELRLYKETKTKYEPYAPKEWFTPVFLNPKQIEEAAQMQTNISDFVNQSTVQFIVGDKDLDKDWEAYIAQLKKLNLDQYIKMNQDAYTAKFKK